MEKESVISPKPLDAIVDIARPEATVSLCQGKPVNVAMLCVSGLIALAIKLDYGISLVKDEEGFRVACGQAMHKTGGSSSRTANSFEG